MASYINYSECKGSGRDAMNHGSDVFGRFGELDCAIHYRVGFRRRGAFIFKKKEDSFRHTIVCLISQLKILYTCLYKDRRWGFLHCHRCRATLWTSLSKCLAI